MLRDRVTASVLKKNLKGAGLRALQLIAVIDQHEDTIDELLSEIKTLKAQLEIERERPDPHRP